MGVYMPFSLVLLDKASAILDALKAKKLMLATAESCTGGMIAALFTEIAGSSAAFECGFVTYSNTSKTTMLGVDADIIKTRGAVSEEVARAMALGAREKSGADITISVTGIAGPSGGSKEKPVGLVYIAVASANGVIAEKTIFDGDRESIRLQTLAKALTMTENTIKM